MEQQNSLNAIAKTGIWRSWPYQSWMKHVHELFLTWSTRSRERQHLAALNEQTLKDIGLTPSKIQDEISKFFWQS